LSVDGPLTRSVRDAALALEVIAGPHPADDLSYPSPDRSYLCHVREDDGGEDLESLAALTRAIRGAPYTAELRYELDGGGRLLRLADRGYAVVEDDGGPWLLVARDDEAAGAPGCPRSIGVQPARDVVDDGRIDVLSRLERELHDLDRCALHQALAPRRGRDGDLVVAGPSGAGRKTV
jgi:hypothetical protein